MSIVREINSATITRKIAQRKVTASKRMPPKVGPAEADEETELKSFVLSPTKAPKAKTEVHRPDTSP